MQQSNSIARIQKYSQKVIRAFTTPKSYRLGLAPYRQKNWSAALQLFERAISESANHADSHFKLGMCHFRQKSYEQAKATMERALALSPERTEWKDQLNQTLKHLGKAPPSSVASQEERIRKELETNPNDAELYNKLAHALRKQGKWWQEVDALTRATELKPEDPTWFYRLGEALEVMNRYQQAAEAYGKAIKLKNGKAEAQWYYRQGYCYAREGHDGPADTVKADKAYRTAIEKDTKLKAKRFGIGVFHQQRGHWPQAKEKYQKTLANQPWDAELNYRLGMAHDRCYEWAEAESCYKKALTIDKQQTYWHYRLGFVLERQEKFADAALAYQYAAIHRDQHTPYWIYRWGYVLEQQGLYAEAVQAYLQTLLQQTLDKSEEPIEELESVPDQSSDTGPEESGNARPATDPLVEYAQQFDNQQFIIEALTQHLEQDTTNPEHWYQLGNAFERQQQWVKAAESYGHAVARQNKHKPEWYYRLGYTLVQCGGYKQACEALRHTRILQKAYGVSENKFNKDAGFRQAATYTEYYEGLDIRPKTVLYESYHGVSMSCNPYAIFLYLLNHPEYQDWSHIWVVNDLVKIKDKFKNKKNIIFVTRDSDAYMRYIASASYLINNSTFPTYFIKKDFQCYLNTWHGTPWKTLGSDMNGRFFEHKNFTRNILQTDYLLSPNKHTTNVLLNSHDIKNIYSGEILEVGYPRIDLTIKTAIAKQVVKKHKDGQKKKILYAPTWRGVHGKTTIDTEKIINDIALIKEKTDFEVLFRGHALVQNQLKNSALSTQIVPDHIDTNELLGEVDLLITDYSSILFDYLPLNKPLILYVYDWDSYEADRGLYFGQQEMPGQICLDIQSTIEAINKVKDEKIDFSNYRDKFFPHDDGFVSSRVIDYVFNKNKTSINKIIRFSMSKPSLLLYGGPFMGNGITTSFINLVTAIEKEKCHVSIVIDPGSVEKESQRVDQYNKMPKDINTIARNGRMNMTVEESFLHGIYYRDFNLLVKNQEDYFKRSWLRESKRVFGKAKLDKLVHFEGYNTFWAGLFSYQALQNEDQKSFIYQHSEKYSEYTLKFPYLKSLFCHSSVVDKVISVSKPTMQLNAVNLCHRFGIDSEKFDYCDNLQNPDYVLARSQEDILIEDKNLFSNGAKTFFTMGRLSTEKDQIKLIKAFKIVKENKNNIKLIIVGDGPLRVPILETIKSLSLEASVSLTGVRENPFPLLKKSDCFVLSSNHEGQPMVLYEAMILKKPIISTDIVGSRSAIEGRSGHLVENSEQGLIQGMLDFLDNKLEFVEFDITEYQKEALEMFYTKVCGLENVNV